MKRLILTAGACLFIFTGCSKIQEALGFSTETGEENSREENAVKLSKETTYYNDYLGISFSVPKGWWLYDTNTDNISESKGDVVSDTTMAVNYGDFGSYNFRYVGLLSFGSLKQSTIDNHLGFEISAEYLEGSDNSLASFMEYFEAYMLEPGDQVEYELAGSEKITIKGKPFELRDYLVDREGDDDYKIITLTCPVKEGYFLNLYIDYWPENVKAKQIIIDTLNESLDFY
ncbi:MAG: hypothetical protein LBO65_07860 [Spirochaetaceae bacterium]|jgi:hypothetical protein|nr:hypothetical protein [Spirochaetaceae bacterium]